MNGEVDNGKKDVEVDIDVDVDVENDSELSAESEDTVILDDAVLDDTDADNIGDISVEINVEELIAKIEAGEGDVEEHKKEIHRRLEELEDKRRIELELDSTFNFNLDDDL